MSRFSVEDRARNSTMPVGTYAWLSEPHLLCVLFVIFLVAVGFGTVGELLARLGPNLEPLGVGQEAGGYTRAACSLRYVGLLLEKSPECWGKLRRHVSCKLFVFRQCETEPCSRTPRQCMTPLGLNTTRRTHLGPGPGFHLQGQGMRVRRACAQRTLASPRRGVSPQRVLLQLAWLKFLLHYICHKTCCRASSQPPADVKASGENLQLGRSGSRHRVTAYCRRAPPNAAGWMFYHTQNLAAGAKGHAYCSTKLIVFLPFL